MKPGLSLVGIAGVAAVISVLGIVPVKASDPVGVYALVDKVVFEPGENTPKAVQIWGAFTLAVTPEHRPYPPEEGYGPATKGYLYYACPAGKSAACAAEWSDLKSMAGKAEVAGFGTRWGNATPKVRAANTPPSSPDLYEINIGVVKMGRYGEYPALVSALKTAIGRK